MWRFGVRLSKKTLCGCSVVTATCFTVILLLYAMERVTVRKPSATGGRDDRGTPGVRHWWLRPGVGRGMTYTTSPYNADNKRELTVPADSGSGVKVISWQAARTWRVLSTTSDMFAPCPVSACRVSPSSKSTQGAAAVVFDDGKMAKQTPPMLRADRVLVYYNMRTPGEATFRAKGDLFARYWTAAITWVWSYRLDSDIFQPFAYIAKTSQPGKLKSVADGVRKKGKVAVWINPKVSRRADGLEDIDKNFHTGKSLTGVEEYLKEFKKELAFDTMDMIDLQAAMDPTPAKRAGRGFTLSKYFFVLAFEWVACRDYVTDLLFATFDPRVQAVPVVRGGFNYTQHLPPDTYINADLFAGPRELARYLDDLASDSKAYSKLLWRKGQYSRQDGLRHAWCQLCDMLHRAPRDAHLNDRYDDVQAWFTQGASCTSTNTTDTTTVITSDPAVTQQSLRSDPAVTQQSPRSDPAVTQQ